MRSSQRSLSSSVMFLKESIVLPFGSISMAHPILRYIFLPPSSSSSSSSSSSLLIFLLTRHTGDKKDQTNESRIHRSERVERASACINGHATNERRQTHQVSCGSSLRPSYTRICGFFRVYYLLLSSSPPPSILPPYCALSSLDLARLLNPAAFSRRSHSSLTLVISPCSPSLSSSPSRLLLTFCFLAYLRVLSSTLTTATSTLNLLLALR